MPPITRIGDLSSGDPCGAPSHPPIVGSPNVFVEKIPAVRVGDQYADHACPASSSHSSSASSGSSTVFVNGKPVHRIGDSVSCGSTSSKGAGTVSAG